MTVLSNLSGADFEPTAGDNPVWRVRSDTAFLVDGKEAEYKEPKTSRPYYQYVMTAAQSEAFDLMTSAEDFDTETDTLTLPDGGHRGRTVVRGQTLAEIVAAKRALTRTPATETPATGKAK